MIIIVQRRGCWTPEQKLEIVKPTNEPESYVSLVGRKSAGMFVAELIGNIASRKFRWS